MKPGTLLPFLLFANLLPRLTASESAAGSAGHSEHQAPEPTPAPAATPHDAAAEERASLLRIGAAKLTAGDGASALIAFRQAARSTDDETETAQALLGMARAYRLSGDNVKATATYEHIIKNHPAFVEIPSVLLELGRTLRDLGSPKLAISRFYSVIHSTLKLPATEAERYRRIVRTAQFEIAETHLADGNFAEAARFFTRLDLLDLAPADRARARFKAAQARLLSGDHAGAVTSLIIFIAQDPDDPHSPEARFLLAQLLAELGRRDESLRVTLELLHYEHARGNHTSVWRSWQRRTGNQLANQFYQQGEFSSALLLYRALDALDSSPAWRVPVLYHIGLCLERLEQPEVAIATYEKLQKLAGETPPNELTEILRMAAWRTQQITWTVSTRAQIQNLRPSTPPLVSNTP